MKESKVVRLTTTPSGKIFGAQKVSAGPNHKPMVHSTDPRYDVEGVELNKVIEFTFNTTMNPSTINNTTFTLKQGKTLVPGKVTYSGKKAEFCPSDLLKTGTIYTATMTSGAKDLAGNSPEEEISWSFTTRESGAGPLALNLGSASDYAILAGSSVRNKSVSDVKGNIGLSPAVTNDLTGFKVTSQAGFANSTQVSGKIYASDMLIPAPVNLSAAIWNMTDAYKDAEGRTTPDFKNPGEGNIGGKSLTPGLYKFTGDVSIPSKVTLHGGPQDVYIFQVNGSLSVSKEVRIILSGGLQVRNIFWQVAGPVVLGEKSHFEGTILSMKDISLKQGATLHGRILTPKSVDLDACVIIKP